jgi:hypothetical protein
MASMSAVGRRTPIDASRTGAARLNAREIFWFKIAAAQSWPPDASAVGDLIFFRGGNTENRRDASATRA